MNVEVSQGEGGESGSGEYKIGVEGAGIIKTTLRAIGVDDRETSGRGVEETVRVEEVQGHNITPTENPG